MQILQLYNFCCLKKLDSVIIEFGVQAEFNNERLFLECDIIFVCVLPGQANEVFKEVKHIVDHRIQ